MLVQFHIDIAKNGSYGYIPLKLSYGLCQVTDVAHQVLNIGLKNWERNRAVVHLDLQAES